MGVLGLQLEAFLSQTFCLASPAIVHLLSSADLSLSSLVVLLQRVDSAQSVCTLHSFPPPSSVGLTPKLWVMSPTFKP